MMVFIYSFIYYDDLCSLYIPSFIIFIISLFFLKMY